MTDKQWLLWVVETKSPNGDYEPRTTTLSYDKESCRRKFANMTCYSDSRLVKGTARFRQCRIETKPTVEED